MIRREHKGRTALLLEDVEALRWAVELECYGRLYVNLLTRPTTSRQKR